MTPHQLLCDLHDVCHFQTKEGKKVGKASKSELRRWIQNGAVFVNGVRANLEDEIDEVISLVLFPKNSKAKTTIW